MSYRLKLELDGLPRMANIQSGKSHWRHGHAEAKRWQQYVVAKVPYFAKPQKPLERARLTLIRFSSSEPDFDGLVRGFKSVVDGLVMAGVLANDKLSNTGQWNCHWEKAPPKKGRILVLVEEWV